MENETITTVLNLIVQYGNEKHNRAKKDILQKIEDILTNERQGKYGKSYPSKFRQQQQQQQQQPSEESEKTDCTENKGQDGC